MSTHPRRMIAATLWSTPFALGVAALFAGPFFGGEWRLPDRLERFFPTTQDAERQLTTIRWPVEDPLDLPDPAPADNRNLLVLIDEPDIYPRLDWAPWPESKLAADEERGPTLRLWRDEWWSGWGQARRSPDINFPEVVTAAVTGSGGVSTIIREPHVTGSSPLPGSTDVGSPTNAPVSPTTQSPPTHSDRMPVNDPPGPGTETTPAGPVIEASTPPIPQETPQTWLAPFVPDLGPDNRSLSIATIGEPAPLLVFAALLPALVWHRRRGNRKSQSEKLNH